MKYKMYNTDPMCARLINKFKEKNQREGGKERGVSESQKGGPWIKMPSLLDKCVSSQCGRIVKSRKIPEYILIFILF